MTRELFTKDMPQSCGWYYGRITMRYGKSTFNTFEEPVLVLSNGTVFSRPGSLGDGYVDKILFGPRIPSPSELAGNTTNEEKPCES